jgi:hypothetical protein
MSKKFIAYFLGISGILLLCLNGIGYFIFPKELPDRSGVFLSDVDLNYDQYQKDVFELNKELSKMDTIEFVKMLTNKVSRRFLHRTEFSKDSAVYYSVRVHPTENWLMYLVKCTRIISFLILIWPSDGELVNVGSKGRCYPMS